MIIMPDDKFILVGLDDENSKAISEVLGNKTCKKILDYLSDIKDASEQDIAKGLKIPINTIEYNLNKLIKSGLVERTKNFFWSVKGKKIPMYKLARKHIIISPSNKKPNLDYLRTIIPVVVGGFAGLFAKYLVLKNSFNSLAADSVDSGQSVLTAVPEALKSGSVEMVRDYNNISYSDISLSVWDKLLGLPYWVWFLAGAVVVFILILILNKLKGGKHGKIS